MQTKTTTYAMGTTTAPGAVLAVAGERLCEETLTAKEREAYQVFQKARPDTLWGAGIREALRMRSYPVFRRLITQLQEAANDDVLTMEHIIGKDGVKLLKEL